MNLKCLFMPPKVSLVSLYINGGKDATSGQYLCILCVGKTINYSFKKKKILLFIYLRERGRGRDTRGGEAEEREKQAPTEQGAQLGAQFQNPGILT